jgi:hypothetical protein
MKATTILASAAIAAVCAGIAAADDLPLIKEGAWQTRVQMQIAGKNNEQTMKQCVSKESQQKDREFSDQLRKKDQCTYTVSHPSANSWMSESHCAAGSNPGALNTATMTFQGDDSYHMEVHSSHGGVDAVTIMDGKYLGACPVDMKPGDLILPNGMKMNSMNAN